MALLLAADVVERQLQIYLDDHGIAVRWGAQERILVCLTARSNARAMLESGHRNALRFHGALMAAYVEQSRLDAADRERLDSQSGSGAPVGSRGALPDATTISSRPFSISRASSASPRCSSATPAASGDGGSRAARSTG